MEKLLLDSLEIRNFRAFRHLRIERLGRVNLIVGKNNVGKSSLLEALWLYVRRGAPSVIWEQLDFRDESRRVNPLSEDEATDPLSAISNLFHGPGTMIERRDPIEIGSPVAKDDNLSIGVDWYEIQNDEDGRPKRKEWHFGAQVIASNPTPFLEIKIGDQKWLDAQIDLETRNIMLIPRLREIPHAFVSASGMNRNYVIGLWDRITLTQLEEQVVAILQIIDNEVERVNLVSNSSIRHERIPMIKLANQDIRVPLRRLGEGMNRLFGIALAMVNSKDGILLIDEVENGIHYSVQLDLWRLIFQVARRLNVQVFATTHSWDCIEAFQQAAHEDKQEEGMLIRLGHKKGDIVATLFDEEELAIATREQIEVR